MSAVLQGASADENGIIKSFNENLASDFVLGARGPIKALFFPDAWRRIVPDGFVDFPWKEITPAIAVRAIENFLETGNPGWDKLHVEWETGE